jgi:hypothetical protein
MKNSLTNRAQNFVIGKPSVLFVLRNGKIEDFIPPDSYRDS